MPESNIDHSTFSKLAEFTAHCQIANDLTCFADHNL